MIDGIFFSLITALDILLYGKSRLREKKKKEKKNIAYIDSS